MSLQFRREIGHKMEIWELSLGCTKMNRSWGIRGNKMKTEGEEPVTWEANEKTYGILEAK